MAKAKVKIVPSKPAVETEAAPPPTAGANVPAAEAAEAVTLESLCPDGKDFGEFKAWFDGLQKEKIFRDAQTFQKEVMALSEQVREKGAEIFKLTEIAAGFHREVTEERREYSEKIDRIEAEKNALVAENTVLKAAIKTAKSGGINIAPLTETVTIGQADNGELLEVVAVPPNPDVKVFPVTLPGGRMAKMEKDEDGFYHFHVPRKTAETLLGNTSGIKYVLVGPDEKVTFMWLGGGLTARQITALKHVKTQYPTGGVQWVPVIEEDENE